MLSIATARQKLLQEVNSLPGVQNLNVSDALGRVLAADITAPMNLPPFENSAMDGYAVRGDDPVFAGSPPYRLKIVGKSLAGHPWSGALERGAVRIFTGAAMPEGADTVVLQEDAKADGEHVEFTDKPEFKRHVRVIGNDVREGERILTRGTRLRAFELGWVAACGIAQLQVVQRPRIGIFATGDELRPPGSVLEYGQIYESNQLMIHSLASQLPVSISNLGILSDDRPALLAAIAEAAKEHHLLITSGGISVGESDLVRQVVAELGDIDFWRVAIKPGKPFAAGRIGDCMIMGLPGNPASAVVTFLLFVAPAILQLAGSRPTPPLELEAKLDASAKVPRERTEFQRGKFRNDAESLLVQPTGSQDSNRIGSFRDANCLIRLDPGSKHLPRGAKVKILPFHGLLYGG